MSSAAQIAANQANAQHSTGPKTEAGKQASCLNNFRHGLAGVQFSVLEHEDEDEYNTLLAGLMHEHQPATFTERILVEKMAQHFWLSQRAQYFADHFMSDEKKFALYLRYQTTNDRAFHKCVSQLLKVRAESRKARLDDAALSQRAESQKRKEADEIRKQELHEARVRLANAKAADLELETRIRETIEAPIPGRTPIPFDQLKDVLASSLREVAATMQAKQAA